VKLIDTSITFNKCLLYFTFFSCAFVNFSSRVNATEKELLLPISTINTKGSCAAVILNEAYNSLGIKLKYDVVPAQRALIESNNGHLDGVINRIKGIEKDFPNLIRIPTPICINTYAIYMIRGHKNVSIDFDKLTLAIKIGNTPMEQYLDKFQPYKATTYEQLINMLIAKRIDAVAMNTAAYANAVSTGNIQTSIDHIIEVDYTFPIDYGYHYLHKKHFDLVPLISKKLAHLKREGYIQKANQAHRNYLLNRVIDK
jgi:polar amino acid transport system substrate-binding protein